MKKLIILLGNIALIFAFLFTIIFNKGLTSNPIGQFTGFQINHQQTGWGTYLYYLSINPLENKSSEVKIAVIDSGISNDSLDEFNLQSVQNFSSSSHPYDVFGHGTKISSIIGAKDNHVLTLGLSPDSAIFSYKVVDDDGIIKNDYIIRAFEQAIKDRIDIINLSMVLKNPSQELKNIISSFIDQGGYVVTPAYDLKNINALNPLVEIEGVISVGTFNDFFHIFNPQKNIDYYAPYSQETLSLNNEIVRSDGSSFSTAFVSGTIANLMSQGKTDSEITEQLQKYFGEESIYSKRNIFMRFYEEHLDLVNDSYMILSVGLILLFVLEVVLVIIVSIKVKNEGKWQIMETGLSFVVLLILAFLLLPMQM
ncbi:S8/S53 family peptidase [Streptococcus suis]|nr:S8/S53 family peptidase [Streptococcus suis]